MDDHEHRARLARSHSVFGADRFGRAAERFAGTRHAAFPALDHGAPAVAWRAKTKQVALG